MIDYLEWLVIACPLLAGLVNVLAERRLARQTQSWVAIAGLVGAAVAWLPLGVGQVLAPGLSGLSRSLAWIKVWDGERFIEAPLRLYIDGWSVWMALIIIVWGVWMVKPVITSQSHRFAPAWVNVLLGMILLVGMADNLWTALLGWTTAGWLVYARFGQERTPVRWTFWLVLGDLGLLLAICLLAPRLVSLSVSSFLAIPSANKPIGGLLPVEPVLPVVRSLLLWALLSRWGLVIPAQRGQHRWTDMAIALFFALPGTVIWLRHLSPILFPLTVWEILAAGMPVGLIGLFDRVHPYLSAAGQFLLTLEARIAQATTDHLTRLLPNNK